MLLLLGTATITADTPAALPVREGDLILFLGNGYVENDQWHAYFEARLQRRFPKLTFRYMGWSGDTVRASARTAGYQVPQGLARLEKDALALKPTVIFLAYGMNESFDGPEALPGFLEDYARLLKTLAPLHARLVILSPTYHEDLGQPFPDPAEHNQRLREYIKALKGFTGERKLPFVDLFHPLESTKNAEPKVRLTTNGILLTEIGYIVAASAAEEQLGFAPQHWYVNMDRAGKVVSSAGTKLASISTAAAGIRFQASDTMLPEADFPAVRKLRITGLLPGVYNLKIDDQVILQAEARQWQRGVDIFKGPMFDDAEKLRAAIVLRNQLFYRRWRPYNDHSRHWGFIGGDFKLYDQDIAAQEKHIADLRKPRPRIFEIGK